MAIVPPIGAEQPWYVITYLSAGGGEQGSQFVNYKYMQTSAAGAAAQVATFNNAGEEAGIFGGPYQTLAVAQAATKNAALNAPVSYGNGGNRWWVGYNTAQNAPLSGGSPSSPNGYQSFPSGDAADDAAFQAAADMDSPSANPPTGKTISVHNINWSNVIGPFASQSLANAAIPTIQKGQEPNTTTPAGPLAKAPATAPGTKKGAAPVVATIPQPKFDKRMRTVRNPLNGGVAAFDRGFMVWDTLFTSGAGYDPKNPPSVSFLFNPSTVQASYAMSDSTAQAAMIFGVAGGGTPFVGLQQQMNFTIMFDRTYEVQWPPNGVAEYAGQDVVEMGCEVDVRAMKQFTGMFSNSSGQGGFYTSGANAANPTAGATALGSGGNGAPAQTITQATGSGIGPQQGIMLIMPSYCYFGSSITGGTSQYYGYVDSWDVQYTHYTNLMVPIRCVVDVEYTLLPQGSNNLAEFNNSAVKALAAQQNQGSNFS